MHLYVAIAFFLDLLVGDPRWVTSCGAHGKSHRDIGTILSRDFSSSPDAKIYGLSHCVDYSWW